jgi:hypothetical protein
MHHRSYIPAVALTVLVGIGILAPVLRSADAVDKQAEKASGKYVGATGCKFCHQGKASARIYETWETTEHAKAFEHLDEANRDNAVCLACHTTGFGRPLAAGVTAASLRGVQCEACHGAGSEYKRLSVMKNPDLAASLGLIKPSAEVCRACHAADLPNACWTGAEKAPRFDFESAYEAIEHHIPEPSRK